MQSTEGTTPNTDKTNPDPATLAQLENLIDESLQIYELENQKSSTVDELFNSLKIIIEFLSFSVNIHSIIFNLPEDTVITLLPTLELTFRKSNGKTEQKRLDSFTPEVLIKILKNVIPQILGLVKAEKSDLTEKITFLRTATNQLKQLHNLKDGEPVEQSVMVDGS